MSDVKRYDCGTNGFQYCYGCYRMNEEELGDYVRFDDYAELRQQLAASEAAEKEIGDALIVLRKQLEQANEAVRALSEGKPLGPIAGVHTIYNQAVEIKRLKEQLEQAEARCRHYETALEKCFPIIENMRAIIRDEATSPASPQTDSSHPGTDQSNR